MGKLSFSIVQQKLASLRDVEEALARQILYGGDLATNLLEQAPKMDESALIRLLAESHGLPPAPARELPRAPPEALQLVPGDVALRNGLYPLEQAGNTLSVAVSEPLRPDVEQDLSFALGVSIVQHVAPLVRVRQAISRDYGMPLDRRSARVLAKISGLPDPSPSVAPPPLASAPDISALPRPPSMPPFEFSAAAEAAPLYAGLSGLQAASPIPPAVAPAASATGAASPPSVAPAVSAPPGERPEGPPRPAPPKTEPAARSAEAVSVHEAVTAPAPPVVKIPAEAAPSAPAPAVAPANAAVREPARPSTSGAAKPAATLPGEPAVAADAPVLAVPKVVRDAGAKAQAQTSSQYSLPAKDRAAWGARSKEAQSKTRSRHRGPYTAAEAEEDLFAAEERDAVLAAFFDFSRQYFEYSALFVVHGDLAEGKVAYGAGAERTTVAGIGVPLDLPSSLATARNERRFSISALAKDGIDARIAQDLKRPSGKKVLFLPVLVRDRCVLIFYGDHGDADVELTEIGDVIAFAPHVATALENLILRKKTAVRQAVTDAQALPRKPPSVRPPKSQVPSREERVEALAQALATTVRGTAEIQTSGTPSPDPAPALRQASRTPSPDAAPQATRAPSPQALQVSPRAAPQASREPPREAARTPSLQAPRATPGASPALKAPPKPLASRAPEQKPPGQLSRGAPPKPTRSPLPPSTAMSKSAAPRAAPSGPPPKPGARRQSPAPAAAPGAKDGAPPTKPETPERRITPGHGTPARVSTPPSPDATPVFALSRRLTPAPVASVIEPPEDGWDVPTTRQDRPAAAPAPGDGPEISIGLAEADWTEEPVPPNGGGEVVVATQIPMKRYSSEELRLPTVIVNVDGDLGPLVNRVLEGDESAIEPLVEAGARAASVLVARFPGPTHSEPDRLGAAPLASSHGPLLRALARIGAPAVPFVAVRTNDTDAEVRAWATRLLGELPSLESAQAVARRVTDDDASVRRAAIDAGRLLQSDPEARTALRDRIAMLAEDAGSAVETRVAAVEALAHLRDGKSVPRLVRLLAPHDEVARSARWALGVLTRTTLGDDPLEWEMWWKENGVRHRLEWLMDALMHDDPEVRRAAGEELKTLTKEYFGYYDDLPKRDREKAQRRYREWWEANGKARFS